MRVTGRDTGLAELRTRAPESAFSATVPFECGINICSIDVRPIAVGKVQLSIGELPDQKIGNALLAARADEQIRFRSEGHRQILREHALVNGVRLVGKLRLSLEQLTHGLQDIPTPAIVGGN